MDAETTTTIVDARKEVHLTNRPYRLCNRIRMPEMTLVPVLSTAVSLRIEHIFLLTVYGIPMTTVGVLG